MLKALFITAMLVSASAHSAPGCYITATDTDDASAFTDSYISAFEQLRAAKAQLANISDAKNAAAMMLAFSNARDDAECANAQTERYLKSKDDGMSTAALGIQSTSKMFIASDDEIKEYMTKMLNGGDGEKPGDSAAHQAEMMKRAGHVWDVLLAATSAAQFSLIEFGPDNKTKRCLLTTKERADYAKRIKKNFPLMDHVLPNGNLDAVDGPIKLIYQVLTANYIRSHEQPF